MRSALTILAATLTLAVSACTTARAPLDPAREDAAVLGAVIEHTIRPLVHERDAAQGRAPSKVFVYEHNAQICRRQQPTPCAQGVFVQDLIPTGSKRPWGWEPAMPRLPKVTTATLARDFSVRNQDSRPLPTLRPEFVTLADQAALVGLEEGGTGYAALSLPGYSDDRYAVLNSSFWCGARCGYTWTFFLEEVEGEWHVRSKRVAGMR